METFLYCQVYELGLTREQSIQWITSARLADLISLCRCLGLESELERLAHLFAFAAANLCARGRGGGFELYDTLRDFSRIRRLVKDPATVWSPLIPQLARLHQLHSDGRGTSLSSSAYARLLLRVNDSELFKSLDEEAKQQQIKWRRAADFW